MELRTLEQYVAILATMPETEAPVISCYLNLQGGPPGYQDAWNERIAALRKCLAGTERRDFEEALVQIEKFLQAGMPEGAVSLALFARAGRQPFFLPLDFRVPLPTWIAVGPTPYIYHLVEIKDNYDRYVVLLATEESARILAIQLGAVTQEIWRTRPDLRRRVGHEWTKEHFQSHRQERIHQFIHEQVRILDRLMAAGGYAHFILAGSPRITATIRKALPKHLARRLADIVPAASNGRTEDVVAATLRAFLEHEERESVSLVTSC
jgi:protein required for attachment to host cells